MTVPLKVEWQQGYVAQPIQITFGNLTGTGITYTMTGLTNTTSYQLYNITFYVAASTEIRVYYIPVYVNEIGTNNTVTMLLVVKVG